jgi:hypothetical protein
VRESVCVVVWFGVVEMVVEMVERKRKIEFFVEMGIDSHYYYEVLARLGPNLLLFF